MAGSRALAARASGHAGHQEGMVGYVWFCFDAAEAGRGGGRRGCGGRGGGVLVRGTSSSAPASSPVSSASSASASAASSPSASSAASSAPSSAAAVSPRATAAAASAGGGGGPAGCATRDLQAKAGVAQGAAGSLYQVIDFTQHLQRDVHAVRVPGRVACGGDAGHPGRPGGLAVAGRRPRARDARARADGERAAADHPGAELPDGHVLANEDHVPADLPAEPDDARSTWPTRRRGARRTR